MKKKISELIQDEAILEIRRVNPVFVSRYRQAMRNGDKFPPLIIDTNGTVISGNHRYESYLAEYGEDKAVDVIVKHFSSEAERIEEAVRDNSRHGNPLDGISRKNAILKLSELGRDAESIGRLLGISVKRVDELAGISVIIRGTGKCVYHKAVKHGLEHISGQTVKKADYETHIQRDMGVPAKTAALQLTRWLQNDWVDWTDSKTVDAISALYSELKKGEYNFR